MGAFICKFCGETANTIEELTSKLEEDKKDDDEEEEEEDKKDDDEEEEEEGDDKKEKEDKKDKKPKRICLKNPIKSRDGEYNHIPYEYDYEKEKYLCKYCGYNRKIFFKNKKVLDFVGLITTTCDKSSNKHQDGKYYHVPYEGKEQEKEQEKYLCMYCSYESDSIKKLTSKQCEKNPNKANDSDDSEECYHVPYEAKEEEEQYFYRRKRKEKKKEKEQEKYFCMYCSYESDSIKKLTSKECEKNPNKANNPDDDDDDDDSEEYYYHVPYEWSKKTKYFCIYCGDRSSSIKSLISGDCDKNPNQSQDGDYNHVVYEGEEWGENDKAEEQYFCKYCGYESKSIEDLTSEECVKNPNKANNDGKYYHVTYVDKT